MIPVILSFLLKQLITYLNEFVFIIRLNLTTMHWSLLHCKGEPPAYRDFHSATAIGDCMYIFGGRCDNGQWPGAGQSTEYYPDSVSYLVSTSDTSVLMILVYYLF